MTDNVHLVVALCGALVAIIGLMFATAFALDQCAQLRAERDAAAADRDTARALLKQIGVRPLPPPRGGKL